MKQYSFYKGLILRTPAYPQDIPLNDPDQLKILLENTYFKNAISLASPSFYESLAKLDFDFKAFSGKQVRTLKNYVNRMQYRTTPFGLFSGISYLEWQSSELPEPIVIGGSTCVIKEPVPSPVKIGKGSTGESAHLSYYFNPTLYKAGNEYRYIHASQKQEEHVIGYSIVAIPFQPFMAALRRFCSYSKKGQEIMLFIGSLPGISTVEVEDLFRNLIFEQVLLPENRRNTINPRDKDLLITGHRFTNIDAKTQLIFPAIMEQKDHGGTSYVNLHKSIAKGSMPSELKHNISEGLYAISKLKIKGTNKDLENFRRAFKEKFEDQCIPLLLALDPEMGIGYSNLESGFELPQLLNSLHFFKETPKRILEWHGVHSLLLAKLQENPAAGIYLNDSDLDSLEDSPSPESLPQSISVLFRVSGKELYIESAGGATATALSGRFSPIDKNIDNACLEMAGKEIKGNAHVIFAEINSIQESHAINIEHRNTFYDFEIPVMVASRLPAEKQVLLSDIYIAIRENRIILWSVSLKKEVIPRLSSAYNYNRSSLNIYRLLCDLQHQGIRSDFQFDLSAYFPGFSFYPRVSYRSTIVSLAMWQFKKDTFQQISKGSEEEKIAAFIMFAKSHHLPEHIALTKGDQQLVYNTRDACGIIDFLDQADNNEVCIVKEHPFVADKPIVTDSSGAGYSGQFVAMLYHDDEIYKGLPDDIFNFNPSKKQVRTDKKWLYFKLYCHSANANLLLTGYIHPLIRDFHKIDKPIVYFFVRYHDHDGFHIRLRIYCPDKKVLAATWLKCYDCFGTLMDKGLLTALKTDYYKRELERYGSRLIGDVESVFCSSSKWVFELLQKHHGQSVLNIIILASMNAMLQSFAYSTEERMLFCKAAFQSLKNEFDSGSTLSTELGISLRKMKGDMFKQIPVISADLDTDQDWNDCLMQMSSLAQKIIDGKKRGTMCSNLIHMHLNRIFSVQPREQEMVLYFYLWKYYEYLKAKS